MSPCLFNLSAEYAMWNARLDNHKLESKLLGEISTSDMQMTPLHIWKWRETKEHLDKCKRRELKSWLKTQHSKKAKIMAAIPITSWQIYGKKWKLTDFISLSSKMTVDGDSSHEIIRHLLLGRKDMGNLGSLLKNKYITLLTKVHITKAMVFPVVTYGCENWTIKKAECWRINPFELWCTLNSPLDAQEIKSVTPKGNQPWVFLVRTNAEAEAPIIWPPYVNSQLIGRDPDAEKDWGQEKRE